MANKKKAVVEKGNTLSELKKKRVSKTFTISGVSEHNLKVLKRQGYNMSHIVNELIEQHLTLILGRIEKDRLKKDMVGDYTL